MKTFHCLFSPWFLWKIPSAMIFLCFCGFLIFLWIAVNHTLHHPMMSRFISCVKMFKHQKRLEKRCFVPCVRHHQTVKPVLYHLINQSLQHTGRIGSKKNSKVFLPLQLGQLDTLCRHERFFIQCFMMGVTVLTGTRFSLSNS